MTQKLFDDAAAMERVDQDLGLLAELVEMFKADHVNNLKEIGDAIAKNDPTSMGKAAHAIKSALGNLGAMSSFEIAFSMERMGKAGDISKAPELFAQLQSEVVKFFNQFEQFKRSYQQNGVNF